MEPSPLQQPSSSTKVEAIDKASFLAELKRAKTTIPARNVRRCLPKKLVKEIEELLRANPSGIWLSKFVDEFQVSAKYHGTVLKSCELRSIGTSRYSTGYYKSAHASNLRSYTVVRNLKAAE